MFPGSKILHFLFQSLTFMVKVFCGAEKVIVKSCFAGFPGPLQTGFAPRSSY